MRAILATRPGPGAVLRALATAALLSLLWGGASAEDAKEAGDKFHPKMTKCTMMYNLKGWSFVFADYRGEGRITCDNGQSADVTLKSHGGGLTAGKSEIIGGEGIFTEVRDIEEIFGGYAKAEAHGGAGESGRASVVTKGEISLTLSGTGKGVDIGVMVGNFQITKKK